MPPAARQPGHRRTAARRSFPARITTDQRGCARVLDSNVDIGAFEVQSIPLVVEHDRRRVGCQPRQLEPTRARQPGQ